MTANRILLAFTLLTTALVLALVVGAGQGVAMDAGPVPGARPSPTPDGHAPVAPAAPESPAAPEIPPLPDLIVESIRVVPRNPILNQSATIQVTIKNQGTKDLAMDNSFYTDLYIDPAVVPIQLGQDSDHAWGCQAYWVPAGESYTLSWEYTFTDVKVYALYAQVDTDGHVGEANENNNVLGPISVEVMGPNRIIHETHQDFQMGLASGLDLSHPDGVIRRGLWFVAEDEPGVYEPDVQIDDPPLPPSHDNNVNQIRPALTGNGAGQLYAAWEDGRNGGVYNRDIYFARSLDGGATWIDEQRINRDPPLPATANQHAPHLAYDPGSGRLYAVWQDHRSGDYDIYFSSSTNGGQTWLATDVPISVDPPNSADADQLNPSIAVAPSGDIYVVWQDKRNGNDDIYIARSQDGGANWGPNYFVTDDPQMRSQDQVNPSVGVQDDWFGNDVIYVGWEDWRVPDHPEIYVARSTDGGETFGLDVPVDIETAGTSYRVEPSLEVGIFISGTYPITTSIRKHDIHVVWQEGTGDEADVYWTYAIETYPPQGMPDPDISPYPYHFSFEDPGKVSGLYIDSDYVLPPDPAPTWPTEPSWQGQVSLALAGEYDITGCRPEASSWYSRGVFIAWSDAASFDEWRYEIFTRRVASPGEGHEVYELCAADWATGVVNDNAKLYGYRDDSDDYALYRPAATRQSNPSIYADPTNVYIAWDDDRWDEPLHAGAVRNRDVFMTRLDMPPQAVHISPVMGSSSYAPTWYVLSWWGVTEHSTDLLFQTRFGPNPDPPHTDEALNGWTRWTGNPSSLYLGCEAGEGCYYDAPGRHIVGPDGSEWPESPYMQYKVIIQDTSRLTALSQVTIHYQGIGLVYLPMILRNP